MGAFSLRRNVGRDWVKCSGLEEKEEPSGFQRPPLLLAGVWAWLWKVTCKPDGRPMGKEAFTPGTNL